MILVAPAAMVGSPAAMHPAQQRLPVRVLTRHAEKVEALAQAGVEVFPGDLDIPKSIDQVSGILGQPAVSFEQFVTDLVQAFS
jgi:hypothetical protein